jgi:hypothetical protein
MAGSNKNIDKTTGVPATVEATTDIIDLSNKNILDLSNLNNSDKEQLALRAQEATVELNKKANEAKIDIQGTKANLDNFNDVVRETTKDGNSITLTHTQNTSTGRTEVVMGNTEKAAAGKLSRSGAGLDDNTLKIVVAIVVAVVLAAIFLG